MVRSSANGLSEAADSTLEVRHAEALLKAGALQSAIFNSANFSSIATDAKGVIQIFNVGAERMLGYAAAEVMNKITPADISDPQELIARAKALSVELATPITPGFEALVFKASRGIEDIYELTYIRKDGSRFPAVVSVTALRDAQGAIIGYLLIGTDNTARKRAEEALLKAGALQNAIFNSANFSSIATDANGVIQIFNVGAERMLGYAAADVMNTITPADISDPQEVIARAEALSVELATPIAPGFEALVFKASRGIEDIYELTYIRKDGSRFPAVVSVTALRDAQDAIIGYLLIGTDNTARKEAEEALLKAEALEREHAARISAEKGDLLARAEAANRAKDEFLAMLGHELRNPLAPILSAVQLMKLRREGPPLAREVIERQATHLMRLVDDLLDVSRVVRGKIDLQLRPLRLRAAVAKGIEMASPALENARHELAVDVPDDLWIRGDEVRLVQIVTNLVTNAAKYTPPGGHVRVEARRDGGEILLLVKDDGNGIEPELLSRVFELFVQGARGPDRSEGGLGLGLTLVRTLTELHGGTVTARSDGRGKGTEFTVRLPAIDQPHAASEGAVHAMAPPTRRRKILVVDDNADAGSMLALLLREAGHEVATALDALSAEELARSFLPDVGVLDLGLPVVDGIELARRLKALDPRMLLIAVTGYGQEADKRRTADAGFAQHLVKPVRVEDVLSSIEVVPSVRHALPLDAPPVLT